MPKLPLVYSVVQGIKRSKLHCNWEWLMSLSKAITLVESEKNTSSDSSEPCFGS